MEERHAQLEPMSLNSYLGSAQLPRRFGIADLAENGFLSGRPRRAGDLREAKPPAFELNRQN
jgi:hypothetical protein